MIKEELKVSVIIPCYNHARYLPDALASVLAQTYQYWECIIVNDGSTDNTEEIATEWLARDSRFKYFRKENGGLSDARNYGIKHSSGEFILPLDADDKLGELYLEKGLDILKETDYRVVYSLAEFFGDKSGLWELPAYSKEEMLLRNIVFCSAIFHKCDYYQTLGYNVNMKFGWEDWDFWLSLIELGCTFFRLPEVHFYYRVRKDSMINSINESKTLYSYKQIYLNHIDLYLNSLGPPQINQMKFNSILKSKDYRLGKFVLTPLRTIWKFKG